MIADAPVPGAYGTTLAHLRLRQVSRPGTAPALVWDAAASMEGSACGDSMSREKSSSSVVGSTDSRRYRASVADPVEVRPARPCDSGVRGRARPGREERAASRISPLLYLLVGAALVLFALWAINPVPCSDLWWQMKTGELIWREHTIPQTDRFSFMAAGRPWIIQEWATDLFFYLLFTRVSPTVLVLFKMLAFAAAMGLGLAVAWTRCRRPLVAVGTTLLIAYAAHPFADMRPQMVSYVCLAALLLLLERDRAVPGSRARWLVPPLMLLWANCHAAFMAGVTVLLATAAGDGLEAWLLRRAGAEVEGGRSPADRWRRLLLPGALALLATWINPYGPAIYVYPFTLLRHGSMINFVQEWFSPDFHASYAAGYELCLLLLPAALLASRRARRPADLLLVLFWAHESLQSRRHIPVFLIVALPVLAEHLAGAGEQLGAWLSRGDRETHQPASSGLAARSAGRASAAALILLLLVSLGIYREAANLPREPLFGYSAGLSFFPKGGCDFIERQGWQGRLYNEFDWGGYCIWRFSPRQQVFIDGRCEVYFGGPWENHQAIHYAQADWEDRLRAAQVDTLLINPASYLNRVLPTSPEWQQVYADPMALVYRRKQPFAP